MSMNRISLLQLLFFVGSASFAQDSTRVESASPFQAMRFFQQHMMGDQFNPEMASRLFEPDRRGLEEASDLALKLKQVLDGSGIIIYLDEIPRNPLYYDSILNKHQYVLTDLFPEIYLVKRTNKELWVFSDASSAAIQEAHDKTFRFGTGALLTYLPRLGSNKLMGLYMYQYIAILVLAFLSTLIYRIFTFLSEKVIRKVLITSGFDETSSEHLIPIARPVSVFIIVLLLLLLLPVLQLPSSYSHYILVTLQVMLPVLGMIMAYRFVNILALYLARLAQKTQSSLDDQMVPLIRKTLKTFVIITGTLFVLQNLDVPILPLLTGLSIGGLAFALAAQDTIKNFFGSLMIFIDRPFQIGDWVTSGSVDGTVEEVGFRSSRIRTFRNSLLYIPNGKLADSTIDNHGMRKYRRFMTRIGVTYDTPTALMDTFVQGLRQIVLTHPQTNKENFHIYFNDLGSSSLEILFYIFFEVPTWGEELNARHEVLIEIMKLAEKLEVNFAFPTQTLHVENFPGKPSLAPVYLTEKEMQEELKAYFAQKS